MKLIYSLLIATSFLLSYFFPSELMAQLSVDNHSYSQEQLIQKLAGKGVIISNVHFDCPNQSGSSPYGYFEDNTGELGIENGLVLTSGAATKAVGPNDSHDITQSNGYCDVEESDLSTLLTTERKLCDVCKVEFDITVYSDVLVFNYVFGSDEYLEYVRGGYHDVFGFFISGPGIIGQQNLALVPGTGYPVDVNTVNDSANSRYYINNGTGVTPYLNLDIQYDGYTTVFEAKAKVIPCKTYHLKLAIADVKDGIVDSGVFLENKSFQSTQSIVTNVIYEHKQYHEAIEGCNKAYVVFKKKNVNDRQTHIIQYLIKGTAQNGVDYDLIPSSITIPAGQDSAFITIHPLIDQVGDAGENVQLLIKNICPDLPPIDTVYIPIGEYFQYPMKGAFICKNDSVQLNTSFDTRDSIVWSPSSYLSCVACISPYARPDTNTYFKYKVTDKSSGCIAVDSVQVGVQEKPVAGFSYVSSPEYTSFDIVFTNASVHANQYTWDFGDGSHSSEEHPLHFYKPNVSTLRSSFKVILISGYNGLGCMDTVVQTIQFDPLFFPNLISANGDGKNDLFKIDGIKQGKWQLSIYNRWGGQVYRSKTYDNQWSADNVASGIYYYYFENPQKTAEIKGWIEVFK